MTDRHAWWSALRHGGMLVSPSLLDEFFPGLPVLNERSYSRLRDRWLRFEGAGDSPEARRAFSVEVFEHFLGLEEWQKGPQVQDRFKHISPTGARLRPDWVLLGGEQEALLSVTFDDAPRVGMGRGRRAHAHLVELLRATGVSLGILTNGRQFRLVHAGPDFDAWAEWDAAAWFDEGEARTQLNGLLALLGSGSLLHPNGSKLLEAVRASRTRQGELASVLGEQVREAVERLLAPLDGALRRDPTLYDRVRKDPASGHLLGEADVLRGFYQAATRLVMRLVVILFAEARDLLPLSLTAYHKSYGVEGLYRQLTEASWHEGDAALEERRSAWGRLITLFRIVHAGSPHEALPIPAYGGALFRKGDLNAKDVVDRALGAFEQLEPSDLVVLSVLKLLKVGRVRVRRGRSAAWVAGPVDFSDLRTEYIGIVYEGLLDYSLRRAPDDDAVVFLNLGKQPALPLSRLEGLSDAEIKDLVEKLKKEKATAAPATEVAEEESEEDEEEAAEEAGEGQEEDEGDEAQDDQGPEAGEVEVETPGAGSGLATVEDGELRQRASAWAERAVEVAGIVRRPRGRNADLRPFERLRAAEASRFVSRLVGPEELFLVAWGGTRKGTGTFYTRPALAVPTVRRTLEPLCYESVEGQLRPRAPEEILSLKICDPAMGSGSFLVAALRYVTEALAAAVEVHGRISERAAESVITLPFGRTATGEPQEELLPVPPGDERFPDLLRARLKRHVVERCLYGVDLNPLAVELARLALWVETLDRELPFEFLAHKLKRGNSLVGCWLHLVEDYPAKAWDREGGDGKSGERSRWLKEAFNSRVKPELAEWIPARSGQSSLFPVAAGAFSEALEAVQARFEGMHRLPREDREAAFLALMDSAEYRAVKEAMDLWCAVWFWPPEQEPAATPALWGDPSSLADAVEGLWAEHRFFHWELEFPDVFTPGHRGFDAILGNPPWEVSKPNSKEFFSNYDPLYRTYGKQEALRVQRRLFTEDPDLEWSWTEYRAGFKAMSNVVGNFAEPFAVAVARGRDGQMLADMWQEARRARRSAADVAHPFRFQGSADLNTYKLFLESSHHLLREGGRLGFVVPSGIWTDKGTTELRTLFLTRCSWEWCYGFENRQAIFPIHRSFKFAPIVVERDGTTGKVRAAFMRHEVAEWESPDPPTVEVRLEGIRRFAPKTLAFMEFKEKRDLDVAERIYADHDLLGQWTAASDVVYSREFDTTGDSRLFTHRHTLEKRGLLHPDADTRDPRVIAVLRELGFVPLYEGKAFWQWDPVFAQHRYFMNVDEVTAHLHYPWTTRRLISRKISSSTNQRTFVSTLVSYAPHSDSCFTLNGLPDDLATGLVVAFNSLVLDYLLRMKMTTNLNWFIAETLPIPRSLACPSRSVTDMVAQLIGIIPGPQSARLAMSTNPVVRLGLRLWLDAWVAHSYGLAAKDFRHVTSRFPIYDERAPTEHRYTRLVNRVYDVYSREGPASALRESREVAAARKRDSVGMGFDVTYVPDGGWERANEEAARILRRAGVR